jgi:hypothetical protein
MANISDISPARGVLETYRRRGRSASVWTEIGALAGARKFGIGGMLAMIFVMLAPDCPMAAWVADENGCEIWLKDGLAAAVDWRGGCRDGRAERPGALRVTRGKPGLPGRTEMTCDCVASDGRVTGTGSIVGPDFGRFEGNLFDGAAHGIGVRDYTTGERYDGRWRDGKRQGEGLVTSPRGWRYQGTFEADVFSGQGRSDWRNGDWHEGAYLDGVRHGPGKYRSKSGGWHYEGAFVKGVREGRGLLVLETGHTFSGLFKKGKRGCCRITGSTDDLGLTH